jgi:hypothetical protein
MSFWRRYRPARAVKPVSPIRPRLEVLEDRCVPATDMVTTLTGSGAGSLPVVVASAGSGDTIQFQANLSGTIILSNTLDINKNLTIDGAGSGISVSGGGMIRVFQIEAGNTVAINGLAITGGMVTGVSAGGGILNYGSLTLTNSTVTGNSATYGGGIDNSWGTMILSGDTVNNNTSTIYGGGVENDGGTTTIINCTIAANVANFGAGIANYDTLNVVNSTVASNTVTGSGADGGGIWTAALGTQLGLLNTIVFNPNSGAAKSNDVSGKIYQAQADLFGSNVAGQVTSNFGGNLFNINPLLGPLQNNGGPTATMALLPGSPALGAGVSTITTIGSTPKTDQRGNPRPATSIDIGAFQFQHAALSVTVTPSSPTVTVGGSVTFTIAVADTSTNALPNDNSLVTVTLPSNLTVTAAPPGATVNGNTVTYSLGAVAGNSKVTATISATATAQGPATVNASVSSPDASATPGSATLQVTPQSPGPAQDVTSQLSIQRGKLRHNGSRYRQTITLHNAGAPIQGPLYLVVDQLTRKVRLRQPAGRTLHAAPLGSPYVLISLNNNMLGTGETRTVVLTFSNPLGRKIHYSLRVLDWSGQP